jgi:hypothetical protein
MTTRSTAATVAGTTKNFKNLGFDVLTDVVMNITMFWDVTPCSQLKIKRRFEGMYRLHLQGRISRARKMTSRATIDHEDGGDIFLRNVG